MSPHHDITQFPLPAVAVATGPGSSPVFLASRVAFLLQPGLCRPAGLLDPQEWGDFGFFWAVSPVATAAAATAASTAPGGALARVEGLEAAAAAAARALNLPPSRPAMSYADPTALRVWGRVKRSCWQEKSARHVKYLEQWRHLKVDDLSPTSCASCS